MMLSLLMIKFITINADVRMMVTFIIRGGKSGLLSHQALKQKLQMDDVAHLQALRESAFGLGQDVGAEYRGEIGEGNISISGVAFGRLLLCSDFSLEQQACF
jgi:hypothetical protein